MKNYNLYIKIKLGLAIMAFTLVSAPVFAQDEATDNDGFKPVRSPFESTWIIDNQTSVIPAKGTLEFMIQHRFGTVSNGVTDLFGLYAPSNIRMGLSFTIFDKLGFGKMSGPLSIGIGTTKNNRVQDLNLKYGLLQQTRNGRIPVGVTYYMNAGIETVKTADELQNNSDRMSYFHQLIISRRFSKDLSMQISPSVSHYNVVEREMKNDHYALAFASRYKFSAQSALIVNVDQPITTHTFYNPQPNVSLGMEVATSSHAFQIFMTNYNSIVPQRNNMFNQNNPWDKGFMIGFNITRLWGF